MITGTDIDRAVEIDRDADVDALCDALPFQMVEPEYPGVDAIDLAIHLSDIAPLTKFDGYVGVSEIQGVFSVQVRSEYFNRHFGSDPDIVYKDCPQHGFVQKSVMREGVKIFCIENCTFVRSTA